MWYCALRVGIFPIHNKGEGNELCGEINTDRGVQRMEAMMVCTCTVRVQYEYSYIRTGT